MSTLRILLLVVSLGLSLKVSTAQSRYFPPIGGNTWDTVSVQQLGWCQPEIDTLLNYLQLSNTKAFIVLKGGKIAIEKYFGAFTQDSLWYWASAGKSLTSFMVGKASASIPTMLTSSSSVFLDTAWTICPRPKEDLIKVIDQLRMTSGLDDGVTNSACTAPSCLQYKADAGTRWAYHNGPYTLLDEVLSSATNQTLNSYLAQNITASTGIAGLYIRSGDNNVFFSKPRSAARFGLLVLNNGFWNTNDIMGNTTYFTQMLNTSQTLNQAYGYLWWLNGKNSFMVPQSQLVFPGYLFPAAPADMVSALGKNGQIINVVPSLDLVVVRMGNSSNTNEVPFAMNDSIWIRLNKVFCTVDVPTTVQVNQPLVSYNSYSQSIEINSKEDNFYYAVLNSNGKIVFKGRAYDNIVLDAVDLASGIYFVKIIRANGVGLIRKIAIIKP